MLNSGTRQYPQEVPADCVSGSRSWTGGGVVESGGPSISSMVCEDIGLT